MLKRSVAIIILLALVLGALSGLALAQEGGDQPEDAGEVAVERPPTEYFAYFAMALFVLLLILIGVGWIRTQIKTAES